MVTFLKKLEKKISKEIEEKYWLEFKNTNTYLGNKVYGIPDLKIYSTDYRELFLMYCAIKENISYIS